MGPYITSEKPYCTSWHGNEMFNTYQLNTADLPISKIVNVFFKPILQNYYINNSESIIIPLMRSHPLRLSRERKGERCHSAGGILDFELVAHQAAGCHASS